MSSGDHHTEALDAAQSRVKEAAKSDEHTNDNIQGDLHESVQQVSGENADEQATGSGMKAAAEKRHDESKGSVGDKVKDAKDQVKGIGTSSS